MHRSFYWQELCPKLAKRHQTESPFQKIQYLRKKTATNIYKPSSIEDLDEAAAMKWMLIHKKDHKRKRVPGTLADVLGSRENEKRAMVGLFEENFFTIFVKSYWLSVASCTQALVIGKLAFVILCMDVGGYEIRRTLIRQPMCKILLTQRHPLCIFPAIKLLIMLGIVSSCGNGCFDFWEFSDNIQSLNWIWKKFSTSNGISRVQEDKKTVVVTYRWGFLTVQLQAVQVDGEASGPWWS